MLHFDLTRNLPQHRLRFRARLPQEPTTSVLCGANGSGKSLLLSMLAGVETPDEGRITFGKQCFFDKQRNKKHNLPPDKRRIGYAFQEARLFPHLSVARNLDYAHRMRNTAPFDKTERDAIIEAFALSHLLERHPSRLSGGEQQRVALARALLSNPSLLLLDEPLSSLDRRHRRSALNFLHRWLKKKNLPCIYVSHEIEEVACIATHALVVATELSCKAGETITCSKIASSGSIDVATTDLRTSLLTGASPTAVVPVVVKEQRALDGLWTVAFLENPKARFHLSTHKGEPPTPLDAAGLTPARTTHVRIRAEDVLLAERDDPHALPAQILALSSAHDGSHTAQITCARQRLLMQLSTEQAQSLQRAKTKTCRVRIRKAQGGIL